MRLPTGEERLRVQHLAEHAGLALDLDALRAQPINDGGMGSLRFDSATEAARFGSSVAKAAFEDEDGVPVTAPLPLGAAPLPVVLAPPPVVPAPVRFVLAPLRDVPGPLRDGPAPLTDVPGPLPDEANPLPVVPDPVPPAQTPRARASASATRAWVSGVIAGPMGRLSTSPARRSATGSGGHSIAA